ncbi:MAG: glycosyl hydrolase [Rhodocyclaceae bacterium]|nr:glycosyl hydrolase [Rhodocyclaceae bacterium]MBX3667174.1 glycosyl hydrolase [Rhodocyclaceae bacterium]
MGWYPQSRRPGLAVLAVSMAVCACTPQPDMSGIAKERQRPIQRYDISQAVAANSKVVVAGTQSGAVLVSSDQGKSWARQVLGAVSLVDIKVCGEGFVAIDHYHKVWSADAAGANWKSVSLTDPLTPIVVACDPGGGWWVAGTQAVIAASHDQGTSWQVTDLKKDAQLTTLQFIDADHAVAMGEFGITVFSDDGGKTWQKGPKIPGDFYPYAALFTSRNQGWVSGIAGQILVTTDGGKTWQKQNNLTQAPLYRLFLHEGVPYGVGAGGTVARLDGDAWRTVPYPDTLPVFLGGGTPLPGQKALVAGGPGGVLRAIGTDTKQ